MAKQEADELKIVMSAPDSVPLIYSNHQGVSRTGMEFILTFNMIQLPLDGVPVDKTLTARPVIQVVMPHLAAMGLLETMAAQLGRRVEPVEPQPEPAKPRSRRTSKA